MLLAVSLLCEHGGYTWGGQPGCSVGGSHNCVVRACGAQSLFRHVAKGKELVTSAWLELGARVFFRWEWETCMKYRVRSSAGEVSLVLFFKHHRGSILL